jgi:hypothetical protein
LLSNSTCELLHHFNSLKHLFIIGKEKDELSLQHSEVRGDDELSCWTEESFIDSVLLSIYDGKSSLQTHDSLSIMSEEVVTEYGRPHFLMPQQQQVVSEYDDYVNEEHSCSESSLDSSSSFDSDNDDDSSSAVFSLRVPRHSGHVSGLSCFDSLSSINFSEDLDDESSVKDSAHPSCSANRNRKLTQQDIIVNAARSSKSRSSPRTGIFKIDEAS